LYNWNQLEVLVGQKFWYSDQETGIGWDVEIGEFYRSHGDGRLVFILTDNIRVPIGYLDIMRGPERVVKKLIETYRNSL